MYILERTDDFRTENVEGNEFTFCMEGNINKDTGWVLTTNGNIIVGGENGAEMTFEKFSSCGSSYHDNYDTFTTLTYGDIELTDETCGICSIDYDENTDKTITQLLCNHCYHTDCINRWFDRSSTCPYCRRHYNIESKHHDMYDLIDLEEDDSETDSDSAAAAA